MRQITRDAYEALDKRDVDALSMLYTRWNRPGPEGYSGADVVETEFFVHVVLPVATMYSRVEYLKSIEDTRGTEAQRRRITDLTRAINFWLDQWAEYPRDVPEPSRDVLVVTARLRTDDDGGCRMAVLNRHGPMWVEYETSIRSGYVNMVLHPWAKWRVVEWKDATPHGPEDEEETKT